MNGIQMSCGPGRLKRWGWLKGSAERYKRFSSIPKDLSLVDQLTILNEENELVKQALVDQHIIDSI